MANFTSKAAGSWETTGQVTWNEANEPGDGDKITSIVHNITVDDNEIIGDDTGDAILGGATTPTLCGLTISATKTLTVKGDIHFPTNAYHQVVVSAGSTLKMYPSSSVALELDFAYFDNLVCNGSSGSRATVTTDKGRGGNNSLMTNVAGDGLHTATYTDFSHFGTTTAFGLRYIGLTFALTITNSTFDGCNFAFVTFDNSYDHDITFQNNTFINSPAVTNTGFSAATVVQFSFHSGITMPGSSTWLIDTNGFDADVEIHIYYSKLAFTNNVLRFPFFSSSGSAWSSDAKYSGNIIYFNTDEGPTFYGPTKDCFIFDCDTVNQHFMSVVSGGNVTGWVYDCDGPSADGDCIFIGAASTVSVTGCLVIGDGTSASGKLVNALGGVGAGAITCNHNTISGTPEGGIIHTDEAASSHAGHVTSCQSNLLWAPGAHASNNIIYAGGSGTPAVDAVTLADYNAIGNPNIGDCYYNTSTLQTTVVGYEGIKISLNDDYPNAQVGANDLTITGNPFVDSTRNWIAWGVAIGGTAATHEAAFAYMAANPSVATDATNGVVQWVKNGFKVTGSQGLLIKDNGHDSVTRGAMAYDVAAAVPPGGVSLAGGMHVLSGGIA
jgi:hypothetical protein